MYAPKVALIGEHTHLLLSTRMSNIKELAEADLPDGVILRDVGAYHLEDFPGPRRIFQVVMADLAADFPPLRNLFTQFNNLPAQAHLTDWA